MKHSQLRIAALFQIVCFVLRFFPFLRHSTNASRSVAVWCLSCFLWLLNRTICYTFLSFILVYSLLVSWFIFFSCHFSVECVCVRDSACAHQCGAIIEEEEKNQAEIKIKRTCVREIVENCIKCFFGLFFWHTKYMQPINSRRIAWQVKGTKEEKPTCKTSQTINLSVHTFLTLFFFSLLLT